jgi:hypothetical protein
MIPGHAEREDEKPRLDRAARIQIGEPSMNHDEDVLKRVGEAGRGHPETP